jgi:G-protein alpha subunit
MTVTIAICIWSYKCFLAAWVPFFDDMNAIIFLAPISCFDQALAEDPSVNRLVRPECPLQLLIIILV